MGTSFEQSLMEPVANRPDDILEGTLIRFLNNLKPGLRNLEYVPFLIGSSEFDPAAISRVLLTPSVGVLTCRGFAFSPHVAVTSTNHSARLQKLCIHIECRLTSAAAQISSITYSTISRTSSSDLANSQSGTGHGRPTKRRAADAATTLLTAPS
jgi:hypothetical protein